MNTVFVCLSLLLELTCAYVYMRDAIDPQRTKPARALSLLWSLTFSSIGLLLLYYLLFE